MTGSPAGLTGRGAIVTGAASGIGRAIALGLAGEGVAVCAVDRDAAALAAAAEQIASLGGPSAVVPADVRDPAAATAARDVALREFGSVDVLVNCAGIAGAGRRLAELSLDDWNERLAVNVTSCFLMCQAVVPAMLARSWGRIVNVSSQLALRGASHRADYCASKAAMHGLTFALARELADTGITVNAVAPGPVETPMLTGYRPDELAAIVADVPVGRLGRVEEIVPAVLMLAADTGAYTTGTVLNISGGDVIGI